MSDNSDRIINTAVLKKNLELVSKRQSLNSTSNAETELQFIPKPENEGMNIITPGKLIQGFNVPENILIVFDRVKDEIETDFFECGDEKVTPRDLMHRVLRMFINNKIAINDKHSFAIMALNDGDCSLKVQKFTKNVTQLDKALQSMSEGCDTEDVFNMNHVFEIILDKHGGLIHYDEKLPPDMVYRVIFCYGRSFTLPILNLTPRIKALLKAPNFFFDVVYTHEPHTTPSKHEEIFNNLQKLDRKDVGYLFCIERNLKGAHLAMAHLLAHPFQRRPQKILFPILSMSGKIPITIDDEKADIDK